jgi:hypothetical protein
LRRAHTPAAAAIAGIEDEHDSERSEDGSKRDAALISSGTPLDSD